MPNQLSKSSYFFEAKCLRKVLGSGTCFFLKRNNLNYLVTNWHLASGQDANTKEPIYSDKPTHFHVQVFDKSQSDSQPLVRVIIPLYDSDNQRLWLEHPTYKEKVDVIALKVEIPDNAQIYTVEECLESPSENVEVRVSDDVYILGFPLAINAGKHFPIWKRASVATEPSIDIAVKIDDGSIKDLPHILVDSSSREGMSGSPVVFKELRCKTVKDESNYSANISTHFTKLVGIYSGRISDLNNEAQLGIVWKYQVIDEIIPKGWRKVKPLQ